MENILTPALKKRAASLVLTPIFYGWVKLDKSIHNLLSWHKPFRSAVRAVATGVGAFYGTWVGMAQGAVIGTAILPVVGTVIGGVIGGFVGGLLASSLTALISKHLLRAASTIGIRKYNESVVIDNTRTNPHKYELPKINNELKGNMYSMRILQRRLGALKDQKSRIGFWGAFFWTEEHTKKLQLNQLLNAIKANPSGALGGDPVFINPKESFTYHEHDGRGVWEHEEPVEPMIRPNR